MLDVVVILGVSGLVGLMFWLVGYAMGSHDYGRLMKNDS